MGAANLDKPVKIHDAQMRVGRRFGEDQPCGWADGGLEGVIIAGFDEGIVDTQSLQQGAAELPRAPIPVFRQH
jgi:hypothetical protein